MVSSVLCGVGLRPTEPRGSARRSRPLHYAGRGRGPAGGEVDPCGKIAPAPREIISCSSSGFDERESAVCNVITFLKYNVANDWLKVCIPYLAWPVCIME